MKTMQQSVIYTIGHSTHTIEEFLEILKSFEIEIVVDIRRLPGSRKYPQFNQDNLKLSLEENAIEYLHFLDLGGRRIAKKDSKNNRWNNSSFKGYADYMETSEFENAIVNLETVAKEKITVYMCSEVLWWRCHRSMVSDYLKLKGWAVKHIMGKDKFQEHRYTSPALIIDGKLSYSDSEN